ncbi:O-acetyl-ADP-ribose deacetylase [Dyella sp.]|uniref:O-acetyl-ADP-ribose deacetylase n=1 Tax=Dyella sp. TaxID=1869338 RepID=UPI002ED681BE
MSMDIVVDDITQLDCAAIVNAASPSLLGGGGVDGAIHRAAGPELLEACRRIPEVSPRVRCPTGQARITPGFALPARYVIHTVGPVWQGGGQGEAQALAACYRHSIALAREYELDSVAFPAISCGIYGYPPDQAARVALQSVHDAQAEGRPLRVVLCCFDTRMATLWRAAQAEAHQS